MGGEQSKTEARRRNLREATERVVDHIVQEQIREFDRIESEKILAARQQTASSAPRPGHHQSRNDFQGATSSHNSISIERPRMPYKLTGGNLEHPVPAAPLMTTNNVYPNLNNFYSPNHNTTGASSASSSGSPYVSNTSKIKNTQNARNESEEFVFINNNVSSNNRFQATAPPESDINSTSTNNSRDRSSSRTRTRFNKTISKEEEALNCRTCKNKYGLTIFQCDSGHSSCHDCKGRGFNCGICGYPITDMRNRALEDYISERKVACSNEADGCSIIVKMADLQIHLKECWYSVMACPLFAIYGRCHWRGKMSEMAAHFDMDHPQHRQAEVNKELQLFDFSDNSRVIHFIEMGIYNFLLHLKVDQIEQKLFLAVLLMGTAASANNWNYEIQMYNKREPRRKYTYTDTCHSYGDSLEEIFRESKCLTIPLEYAKSYVAESRLCYKFYIKKNEYATYQHGHQRGGVRGGARGRFHRGRGSKNID